MVEEDSGLTREEGAKSGCPEDPVEVSSTSSEEIEEESRTEKTPSRPLSESNDPGNVIGEESAVPLSEGGTLNSTVDPPAPLTENTGDSSLPAAEDNREPIGPVEEDEVWDSEN